jgi:hypothetical protein
MEHPHLLNSIATLIARITKLCWFTSEPSRNIVNDAKSFLNSTPQLYRLGLLLLKTVVQVRSSVHVDIHDLEINQIQCFFARKEKFLFVSMGVVKCSDGHASRSCTNCLACLAECGP